MALVHVDDDDTASPMETIMQRAEGYARDGAQWAKKNPGKAALFGVAGVAAAAPMAVATPVLAVAGFGAQGIVGGK
ncbi:hypothetical protein DL767_003312 [Monosporascus sp. MG133]|nr:hypothetical protein DL767_003312 [Monosporascus sp. MG133]